MNQSLIMDVVDEVVKEREGGVSLKSLGYGMVGIDEGWEGCGKGIHGTQHYVCFPHACPHVRLCWLDWSYFLMCTQANGTPAVNTAFPDLKAVVDYGHSKGVKMGFYLVCRLDSNWRPCG